MNWPYNYFSNLHARTAKRLIVLLGGGGGGGGGGH